MKASKKLALLCDIGNTTMNFGVAGERGLMTSFKMPSDPARSPASLAADLIAQFGRRNLDPDSIDACLACSVMPDMNGQLATACERHLGAKISFVPDDARPPLENRYKCPTQLGADRLVGAWAAACRYPQAQGLVIVDYGTAVTFDCVQSGAFLGGLIFPGLSLAAGALDRRAAQLPAVRLEDGCCRKEPCTDTASGIRSGLLLGYAAITSSFCAMLEDNMGCRAIKIATGGHAAIMARMTEIFDIVLPDLVLEGLALLQIHMGSTGGRQCASQRPVFK